MIQGKRVQFHPIMLPLERWLEKERMRETEILKGIGYGEGEGRTWTPENIAGTLDTRCGEQQRGKAAQCLRNKEPRKVLFLPLPTALFTATTITLWYPQAAPPRCVSLCVWG